MSINSIVNKYKENMQQFEMLSKDKSCTVYHIENNNGDGYMTWYSLFEGIYVLFLDFHIDNIDECCNIFLGEDIMEINHCREGRIECVFKNGSSTYLGEGDFHIGFCDLDFLSAYFPTKHYHGVTIMIDFKEITDAQKNFLKDFDIDIDNLRKKLYKPNDFWLLRRNEKIEHIYAEIYSAWGEHKKSYLRIKIMELLLFLSVNDLKDEHIKSKYYFKATTDKVKEIHNNLTANLNKSPTLNELSLEYKIPLTTLKTCFKDMYGEPLKTYMRTYRIHHATKLLTETNTSITEIAFAVGWENASKFSSTFLKIIGMTPCEYRKLYG